MAVIQGGFWSTETLRQRLPSLIVGFKPQNIETASYALTLGSEAYVSPVDGSSDAFTQTVQLLELDECFTIPPGQFGYLISMEKVTIPPDALAFISFKSALKLRGLVNVSGFHVDPGFSGKLIFTVFNAGPAPVHLRSGQPCFLIWYASLDQTTQDVRTKQGLEHIDQTQIISGEVPSYAGLRDRIHTLEKEHRYYSAVAAFLISVSLLMLGIILNPAFRTLLSLSPSATPSPAMSVSPAPHRPPPKR